MGRELYETEPRFREEVDACCEILKSQIGFDLREVLFPSAEERTEAALRLVQTSVTQPALFVVEYSLARLWMSWGIQPEVMIGHSIGEYVAACLAGVFSLTDGLKLVAERGRLMQRQPAGAMLAAHLTESEACALLNDQLSLAAVNGPKRCVLSGTKEAIDRLQHHLNERQILCTRLQTSHAFHSALMDSMLDSFARLVKGIDLHPPRIPFVSNVSGKLISDGEAMDASYWARHLRQTVRFSDGMVQLLENPERVFIEVGPGQALSNLARQHAASGLEILTVSSIPQSEGSDRQSLLLALGRVWSFGVTVDWLKIFPSSQCRRLRLPTYPFERKRYFVEPVAKKSIEVESGGIGENALIEIADAASTATSPSAEQGQLSEAFVGVSRRQRIARDIKALLGELSGINPAAMNGETFTELGFDSLFLTQVSLAIERQLSVRVAFRELLEEFPTIEALAAHIDSQLTTEVAFPQPATTVDSLSASEAATGITTLPLTDAQRDMWFASQMSDAASCTYNECRLLRFRGRLDVGALRAAWQLMIERHEALRTTFSPDGNSQLIHPRINVDLATAEFSDGDGDFEVVQTEEARTPFDLVNGPLMRARVFRVEDEYHVLVLTVHHIVCDGSSFSIFLRELAAAYSRKCGMAHTDLPSQVKFSDYVRQKVRRLIMGDYTRDEPYWLEEFKKLPSPLDLPADYPRPGTWKFEGARRTRLLPAELVDGLKQLSAQQGCTLFTTLLAGYVLLLRRLTGQHEVVVGIPVADRGHDGSEALVGHCITFLPVRSEIDDEQAFGGHLAQVRKKFLDAHEHQHFSFGSMIQKLNVPREVGRMPLVSVTLNLERQADSLNFCGLETELATNVHSLTNFDLNCNIAELNGTLRLDFQYNRCLFKAETVERWLRHFQTLLESLCAQPHQRVREIAILTEDERERLIRDWNRARIDLPQDTCNDSIFEEGGHLPANAMIYILDSTLQPAPVGVSGEIFLGGEGVARRDLLRPELTPANLVVNPFSLDPKARLYRTRETGRFRTDGVIEILGRADEQVKMRGHRVELAEIEAALREHPGVQRCAVVARGNNGDQQLAAYLLSGGGTARPIGTELVQFLQSRVPEYMIPATFTFLETLPLTPDGKVDRSALPIPDQDEFLTHAAFEPPITLAQQAVARIWQDLLKLKRIGVHDNFFELGGHSLLMIQVLGRIRGRFRINISMRQFFETPTVTGLAEAIEAGLTEEIDHLSEIEAQNLLRVAN